MKKIIIISLVMILALNIVGCGADTAPDGSKIDVDLTKMSSTMVYSKVYEMVNGPDKFVGRKIKMNGLFNYYKDTKTKKEYFACLIQDATACCAQGIEFKLKGKHKYPEDYPEKERELTVVGTWDTYTEVIDGKKQVFCIVKDAELIK